MQQHRWAVLLKSYARIGIHVLSFGGTKNGMMIGEAVVFFNSQMAQDFKYIRKQGHATGI